VWHDLAHLRLKILAKKVKSDVLGPFLNKMGPYKTRFKGKINPFDPTEKVMLGGCSHFNALFLLIIFFYPARNQYLSR